MEKKSLSRYIPKKMRKIISIVLLTKKAIKPSEIEIKHNPSSRSAKLRVIKKIKNPNIKIIGKISIWKNISFWRKCMFRNIFESILLIVGTSVTNFYKINQKISK